MTNLSPTGARILADNEEGRVTGHPAAMDRLIADCLVDRSTRTMTEAGWTALRECQAENGTPAPLDTPTIHRKLPGKQHEAVLTAAGRPDHHLPGLDSRVREFFNKRTLSAVSKAGFADIRPSAHYNRVGTFEDTEAPLYLTPAGREYARQYGVRCSRRRMVIIACGQEKAAAAWRTPGGRTTRACERCVIDSGIAVPHHELAAPIDEEAS